MTGALKFLVSHAQEQGLWNETRYASDLPPTSHCSALSSVMPETVIIDKVQPVTCNTDKFSLINLCLSSLSIDLSAEMPWIAKSHTSCTKRSSRLMPIPRFIRHMKANS